MFLFLKNLFFGRSAFLQQQMTAPVAGLREAGHHAVEHMDAMAELLSAELREYAFRQTLRMALVVVAAVLACAAWLVLCALAAWLLQPLCGWGWALAAVAALNFLTAAVLTTVAYKYDAGEPAPMTCQELKNDWQCIKLLINGNKKC